MKKALKIIRRLEEITSNNRSGIKITRREDTIIYTNNENQLPIQIMYSIFIIVPWLLIYIYGKDLHLAEKGIFIITSIINTLAYFKGSFQTNNIVEIDYKKGEIRINRKGFLGKKILRDRMIKTGKDNKILKEDIPFSDSLDARISLKNSYNHIPLFDLKNDSDFDQIFLSLKLLVKGD